jgi:hypothetical protein
MMLENMFGTFWEVPRIFHFCNELVYCQSRNITSAQDMPHRRDRSLTNECICDVEECRHACEGLFSVNI